MTAEIKGMTSGLTVGAGLAKGSLEFAGRRGAGRGALLERVGIAAAELAHLDARIPFDGYKALMRAAIEQTSDPAFALHYGEHIDFAELSIVGLIVQAAATFGDAFREMNRYNGLAIEVAGVEAGARFAVVRAR